MPEDSKKLYLEGLKRESLKNLNFFTEEILGFKNPLFIREWFEILEDNQNRQIIILCPRSHGKSTAITINYALWEIIRNPEVRVIIASNIISQSQSFLREIVARIEQDKKFRAIFGNLKPSTTQLEKWTDSEIIVRRSSLKKDPTISCVGVSGAVLTKRADLIICDDILDSENTSTPEQRRKAKDWFLRVLLPCLEPNGRLIIAGTRWNVQDLYGELLKDEGFNVRKVYKAIKDNGTVLWPERWSLEKLIEKKKSAGSLIFNQQYQNEAIDDESALFKNAWIKYHTEELDLSQLDIYGAVDPAISQKESADYSVFCTIGVDKAGKIYVLNVDRGHWTISELIDAIFNKYAFFQHQSIGIETIAFQRLIKTELDRISQEKRIYLPTTELQPDRDKYRRILALTPYFENGIILLKENQTDLVDELLQFPNGKHDDCIDSLAYAVQMVKESPAEVRITIVGEEENDNTSPLKTKFGHSKQWYRDVGSEIPRLFR